MKKLMMAITFILHSLALQAAMVQDLRLTVRLDQDTLLESQAVWAFVTLTNKSATNQVIQPLVLTEDPTEGIRFRLIDETGISMTRSGGVIVEYVEPPNLRIIAPGDSLTQMYDILAWFSTSGIENAPVYLPTQHFLKNGVYQLQALQFTGKDTLTSNRVRITILKPSGNAIRTLQVLTEADKKYAFDRDYDAATYEYEHILRSFPQSVYSPYVYYRSIFIYHHSPIQNYQKVLDLIVKLGESFPNDPQSLHTISTYAPIILREGRRDILEKFSREYPQTKVGRFSKRKLQELQQQR